MASKALIRNSRKPHAAHKCHASIFYRTRVIAGILNYAFFSCDLDLDPTNFIYELDPYPLKISPQAKNELFMSKLSKFIVFYTLGATFLTHSVQTEIITAPFREC